MERRTSIVNNSSSISTSGSTSALSAAAAALSISPEKKKEILNKKKFDETDDDDDKDIQKKEPRGIMKWSCMNSTKMIVLCILCLQNSMFTILRRYSQGVLQEIYSKVSQRQYEQKRETKRRFIC